jgi:alpha-L-fucosidase
MGKWLETNGEAIYGTKPWTRTRQWSEGEQPKLNTGEYMTKYEVTEYVERKNSGQAVIETFFTAKGADVYAIIPSWPGPRLTLKDVKAPRGLRVSMLGSEGEFRWSAKSGGIVIELPEPTGNPATTQHAYVLKLAGLGG